MQDHLLDTISGYALVRDRLAIVYYDYLPGIPRDESNEDNVAIVLGCVITHELGHLLLGTPAHSAAGVMKARWGVEELQRALMSQLHFLPEEARLMSSETAEPTRTPPVSALTSH